MRVFELHFNPRGNRNSIFDTFVYKPASQEENNLGPLCMAGELTKALPQNNDFLNNLGNAIKDAFYSKKNFSESLREANNFLDKEAKSGNVNWLGNLNFAILNISDSILHFTKVGDIKILLLRGEEILDVSQNLELQDQEPYPMKVFSNTASGKLLNQDKIIILTQDVFYAISQGDELLNQLALVNREKELKNFFKTNKNVLSNASGICLLITEGNMPSAMPFPRIGLPRIKMPPKIISIIILTLLLIAAYFLFKDDKKEQIDQTQTKIEEARSKIIMAENFIIMKKDEKAQTLFQEAWDILQSVNTKESLSLQESIKKYITLIQQ